MSGPSRLDGPSHATGRGASDRGAEPAEPPPRPARDRLARLLMQVLWPAFLGAVVSVGLVFSVLDPLSIDAVRESLDGSREAAYTIAFVGFWCLHALACGLTWALASTERRQ